MPTSISWTDGHNAQEWIKWKANPGAQFHRSRVKVVLIVGYTTHRKVFREEPFAVLTRKLKIVPVAAGIQPKNIDAQDLARFRMSHADRASNAVHASAWRPCLQKFDQVVEGGFPCDLPAPG